MNQKGLSLLALLSVVFVALSGCQEAAKDNAIFGRYYMTTLKVSKASDVMMMIKEKGELISRSENVIAAWGQRDGDKIIWFNAVAFNEDSTAVRKYGFISNEKAQGWFKPKAQTLRFDAELVIDPEVLDAPYVDENSKKIAILDSIAANFKEDMAGLTDDSQYLHSSVMMARQVLNTILTELGQSPALAAKLETLEGMDYDLISYDAGKVRMIIEDDIVLLKTMTGPTIKDFDKKLDIVSM